MEIFYFKCKYCGGEVDRTEGLKSVGKCKFCGSKQTLPKLHDEKRANLFERANHMLRNNEYDKAEALYEQILNEDLSDPEAYWSLVLCRYGVEYVEDSGTKERKPTINRMRKLSILADEDYKSAVKHADEEQRKIYEQEARSINEIQKRIMEISQKEEPFDVFICYKETDANGRRTQDSVLAQDLYHELTRDGYKVFFARSTLQGKLGSEYEPYIFSALNSAKVMVVLGTKKDYFEAVWVRNEWSRFLAQINKGEKKMLIPAYRDMDAYDMPDEFAALQALDMSRIGFKQDLIEGIEKILNIGKKKEAEHAAQSEVPKTDAKPPKKKKKRKWLIILIVVTLALGVLGVLTEDDQEPSTSESVASDTTEASVGNNTESDSDAGILETGSEDRADNVTEEATESETETTNQTVDDSTEEATESETETKIAESNTSNEQGTETSTEQSSLKLLYTEKSDGTLDVNGYYGSDSAVVIPETIGGKTVTSISYEEAFYANDTLTSIVVPDTVTYIGFGAFINCTSLESLTVPFIGGAADEHDYLGYVFGTTSLLYNDDFVPRSLKKLIITSDETIRESALHCCRGIAEITLPNTLISIGESAFRYCESLISINFGGTAMQWNNVSKGTEWNFSTGDYTVYCTDAELTKKSS